MKVYVCHYAAKTVHAREWKAIAVENLLLIRKRFITSTLALSASCQKEGGGGRDNTYTRGNNLN